MKKTAAVMLGFAMIFCPLFVQLGMTAGGDGIFPAPLFAGGDGSVGDPFQIADVNDLQDMNINLSAHYILIDDIDASATVGWDAGAGFVPVGNDITPFAGSLNGNGHVIRGLHIDRPGSDYVGLFGYMFLLASVSDLSLEDVNVIGGDRVGGLAGLITDSSVDGSHVTGTVSGGSFVGGLVGYNYITSTVTDSYARADVSGTGAVGGLLGYNGGNVSRTYATGDVSGTGNNVGGLIGRKDCDFTTVSNSYATGTVSGNIYVGGLMGRNEAGLVSKSYSTGNVTGATFTGGLIGQNDGSASDCFWDNETSGRATSSTGVPKGTGEMMQQLTFTNFDFTNVWWMVDGETRPFLRMEWNTTVRNDHQLQMVCMNLTADYVMGDDVCLDRVTEPCQMWGSGPTTGAGFYPIGPTPMLGDFDGRGFVITGLYINRSSLGSVALFTYVGDTSTVINVSVEGIVIYGADYAAGLAGLNIGKIFNSHVTGSLSGDQYVGGLVGRNFNGDVSDCHANVTVNATASAGGLVGDNDGNVSNSYATGDVTGVNTLGGLAGSIGSGSYVINSYATGNVSGTSWLGGLVGYNSETISDSYATGNVSGTDILGGLVSTNAGTVTDCYCIGDVNGTTNVGALVASNTGTVSDCFWDNQTCGANASAGGTGKNTTVLKDVNTFLSAGWDFGIWAMKDTLTYPFFGRYHTNEAPVAIDDLYFTDEDSVLDLPASDGMLENDEDTDLLMYPPHYRDTLSVVAYDGFSSWGAALSVRADGGFTFDPTGSLAHQMRGVGETVYDSFSYTVTDGTDVDTATVFVRVNGTNDSPTAYDDQDALDEDSVILIPPFGGVLSNDVDVDQNDVLSAVASNFMTANGAAVNLNAGGGFTYDATCSSTLQALAVGEYLNDAFIYTVIDGNGGYDTATVNVNVTGRNDAPAITTGDVVQAVEGQGYSVDYEAADVDASDTLVWAVSTDAAWLQINATGVLNGTPSPGTFSVKVNVSDGNGGLDWANFTLTVLADTDGDGLPDSQDDDDDGDGWADSVEILAGTDPLDGSDVPADADADGIPDSLDPDFMTTVEYNNQTVWNNQTVYSNNTVWQNGTNNVTVGVSDADSDGDGWTDAEEILAGSDPLDDTDVPADSDGDGVADFMDPEEPRTETPLWAWGALAAAIVLGLLAAVGFLRDRKPEHPPEPPDQ